MPQKLRAYKTVKRDIEISSESQMFALKSTSSTIIKSQFGIFRPSDANTAMGSQQTIPLIVEFT